MTDNAHKTAITRRTLSVPARLLSERGLLVGRTLDYGCGKGSDATTLGLHKYDPYFRPSMPRGKFATIMCNYVLNVVTPEQEEVVLEGIRRKLAPGGVAYIAVRRDVKVEGVTSKGTYQRNVKLDLPILLERKGAFCIYIKGDRHETK
jgi:SAM-dependent methyltransferase